MSEKPSFFTELKRRNVYRAAVAYVPPPGWQGSEAAGADHDQGDGAAVNDRSVFA
jgi:hypothetical protein